MIPEPDTLEELKAYLRAFRNDTWDFGYEIGDFRVADIKDWGDGRWARNEQVIVEQISTGEFYSFEQAVSLTEDQESEVAERLTPVVREVKQVEMTFWVPRG